MLYDSCLSTFARTRRSVTLCLVARPLVYLRLLVLPSVEYFSVWKKEQASGTRLSLGELYVIFSQWTCFFPYLAYFRSYFRLSQYLIGNVLFT